MYKGFYNKIIKNTYGGGYKFEKITFTVQRTS